MRRISFLLFTAATLAGLPGYTATASRASATSTVTGRQLTMRDENLLPLPREDERARLGLHALRTLMKAPGES
jgi:hypothetical protein